MSGNIDAFDWLLMQSDLARSISLQQNMKTSHSLRGRKPIDYNLTPIVMSVKSSAMKSVILVLLFAMSPNIFAETGQSVSCGISDQIQLSTADEYLEVRLLGGLAALLISKDKAHQYVLNSEKIVREETVPYCEKITDAQGGAMTEYTACWSATNIKLRILGGLAAISVPTACVKAALAAKK